jgi:3',5'-cyclic AMP phosphodiesterase CpdA
MYEDILTGNGRFGHPVAFSFRRRPEVPMPVHLHPTGHTTTRRGFLGTLAAAAASPLLLGHATASAIVSEPNSTGPWYAVLSDIHIAADESLVNREQRMAENLKAVVADILAHSTRPAAAFIDGDIAFNSGQPGDYETAIRLLSPLCEAGVPVHMTLGNHDDRTNFRSAMQVQAPGGADVADKHVSVVPVEGHRFILLDSLDQPGAIPGLLGDGQRSWLGRILDDEPQTPVILFVHHNPTPDGEPLKDYELLLDLVRPKRNVKAVVYGHTHRWEHSKAADDVHLVNLPAVAYHFSDTQPLGWTRLSLDDRGAHWTLHALGGNKGASRETLDLPWRSA